MKIKFSCPHCGKRYTTDKNNIGKMARCKTCEYRFTVMEADNIAGSIKSTYIDKILIQGADILYNEIDKIIVKIARRKKDKGDKKNGILNYDPFELLYFVDYIICELLKLEHLSKNTYKEITNNFLRIHLSDFKVSTELKYGKIALFSKEKNSEENMHAVRMDEYQSYLPNIANSWEDIIVYDKDRSLIFKAIIQVMEKLSNNMFNGKINDEFVEESVEVLQLFFAYQIDIQRKFQNLILEEVIKVKKYSN
jgi:transcription elongation factor Elf1